MSSPPHINTDIDLVSNGNDNNIYKSIHEVTVPNNAKFLDNDYYKTPDQVKYGYAQSKTNSPSKYGSSIKDPSVD